MVSKEDVANTLIDDELFNAADKFDLLNIVSHYNDDNDLAVLIAMRLKDNEWEGYEEIASSIVRSRGLFPYLPDYTSGNLSLGNALAKELHRSDTRDVYMHRAQYGVLSRLFNDESVILSAPTSFGKSFLIEEILLSGKYDNVLIVVPTIALIEEIRQKIKKLHIPHKRISFTNQEPSDKNVYILTQERAFEMYGVIATLGIDLLIIDEFYKMDRDLLEKDDADRANMLSVVYRKFSDVARQVYLLGPYIDGANGYDTSKHNPVWIESDDNTTYIVRKKLSAKNMEDRKRQTLEIISAEGREVMVYFSSPGTLRDFYKENLHDSLEIINDNDDLVAWIQENIGPEWYVCDALRRGVGIHHGQLPRFLAHEMIKRFSNGKIKVLLCTSSLIEGVNTCAKTIIIHNGKRKFTGDILTFRNISGRAGRMFNHFWGTVYFYEEPKSDSEIIVNDPIGSENESTSASVLGLLDDNQLTAGQRESVSTHRGGTYIPNEILRTNHFIHFEYQEAVVDLLNSHDTIKKVIRTIREPSLSRSQWAVVLNLASMLGLNTFKYAHSIGNNQQKSVTRLTILIDAYFREGFRGLVRSQSSQSDVTDGAIEDSIRFLKNGMSYDLPKFLRALDRLQKYALGNEAGDLEPIASRIEFLDTKPVYVQLDELGLPIELSKKYSLPFGSTDEAVNALQHLVVDLNGFEGRIAQDFIQRY
ncbi:MAG: ski2-like helicase [Candidatus Saccharibacteria bacterium]|nr:ski2-like helicase [Candidatus Saccharibacteria bacterium]